MEFSKYVVAFFENFEGPYVNNYKIFKEKWIFRKFRGAICTYLLSFLNNKEVFKNFGEDICKNS